jgi:hypothetical protein
MKAKPVPTPRIPAAISTDSPDDGTAAHRGADFVWDGFYVCEQLLGVAGVKLGVILESGIEIGHIRVHLPADSEAARRSARACARS